MQNPASEVNIAVKIKKRLNHKDEKVGQESIEFCHHHIPFYWNNCNEKQCKKHNKFSEQLVANYLSSNSIITAGDEMIIFHFILKNWQTLKFLP